MIGRHEAERLIRGIDTAHAKIDDMGIEMRRMSQVVDAAVAVRDAMSWADMVEAVEGCWAAVDAYQSAPTAEPPAKVEPEPDGFEKQLRGIINRNCRENASNTPDFLLAHFLTECLGAFDATVAARERWYGRGPVEIGAAPAAEPPAEVEPEPPDRVAYLEDMLKDVAAERDAAVKRAEEAEPPAEVEPEPASPLPFRLADDGYTLKDRDGYVIAGVSREKNMPYIVHACNAHPGLIAERDAAVKRAEYWKAEHSCANDEIAKLRAIVLEIGREEPVEPAAGGVPECVERWRAQPEWRRNKIRGVIKRQWDGHVQRKHWLDAADCLEYLATAQPALRELTGDDDVR